MKIHVVLATAVLLLGWFVTLSAVEWLFLLLAISGVLVLELLNTAVERVVDLVTKEYHPLAKRAKDLAAGAVLVYAIFSIVVGFIIFIPKFM